MVGTILMAHPELNILYLEEIMCTLMMILQTQITQEQQQMVVVV